MPDRMTEEITVRLSREEIGFLLGLGGPSELVRAINPKLRSALASQPEHSEEAGPIGADGTPMGRGMGIPAPSPEPGSDAEVAERLVEIAARPGVAGSPTAADLHLAADRLLARPVLSDHERAELKQIAHGLETGFFRDPDSRVTEYALKSADLLRTLAAKSDQENRGEGS